MGEVASGAGREPPRPRGLPKGSPRFLMIVRRGATERFHLLRDVFTDQSVQILWDRRVDERRRRRRAVEADRRQRDRRGPLPSSWATLDFLVAGPAAGAV